MANRVYIDKKDGFHKLKDKVVIVRDTWVIDIIDVNGEHYIPCNFIDGQYYNVIGQIRLSRLRQALLHGQCYLEKF